MNSPQWLWYILPMYGYASMGTSYGPTSICLSKGMDGSSWFMAWRLHSIYHTLGHFIFYWDHLTGNLANTEFFLNFQQF